MTEIPFFFRSWVWVRELDAEFELEFTVIYVSLIQQVTEWNLKKSSEIFQINIKYSIV